ncbi:hypothetical protein NC652_039057 [Populus alba x Populus x berolinensis]|nr:hypothetical protein NC652_039057 [Populus alba x Populus x berolinensis]
MSANNKSSRTSRAGAGKAPSSGGTGSGSSKGGGDSDESSWRPAAWIEPAIGPMKWNRYGSSFGKPERSGIGGVSRDS